MSIVTKTGDKGTTALLYNRRVSKAHPRVVASGEIDELNAALGLARANANANQETLRGRIFTIQQELISLMGEIATLPEDAERHVKDGFARVTPQMTARLDDHVREVEPTIGPMKGWAIPGANPFAAALDLARTVCRRAERAVCALTEGGEHQTLNPQIVVYLNRLSDLLWLWARKAEQSN